jgi:16S rRNA (cytosine967-C5)-methyltransferase
LKRGGKPPGPGGTTSRSLALALLNRWERSGGFADELLHGSLACSTLDGRDRAFATHLFYAALRHRSAIDFWIGELRDGPLDAATRNVVRLGLAQVLVLGLAPHAAVNETVDLAGPKAGGLVNAILRRALREADALRAKLEAAPLAVRFSHPPFLVERWAERFAPEDLERLLAWDNTPATITVRANPLKTGVEALLADDPSARRHPADPEFLEVDHLPSAWLEEGLCYAQDPSTMLAVHALDPKPGDRVLDACAAPGGKAAAMAALMKNSGKIAACDRDPSRVERMTLNLATLGVEIAQPITLDWLGPDIPFPKACFDRILVDAPCSNTGVLRRRVDARWRLGAADFRRMPEIQLALVRAVAPLLRPGGVLVYATCSLEPEENEGMVAQIERELPDLVRESGGVRRSNPARDGMDGAFAARFIRR